MSRGATITATPTTPPKTASASEHAENSSKSVSRSYIAASNTQHDQRYKSDADEQHDERDGVVFEPMPITGKHQIAHPSERAHHMVSARLMLGNVRPWRGSSFDEGQRPSHGSWCGHQYDRGCEHQTQQTE